MDRGVFARHGRMRRRNSAKDSEPATAPRSPSSVFHERIDLLPANQQPRRGDHIWTPPNPILSSLALPNLRHGTPWRPKSALEAGPRPPIGRVSDWKRTHTVAEGGRTPSSPERDVSMSLFSAMTDDGSVWSKGSSLFNISSPLNDLLDKDHFTLEEVLQEDEVIQEVKTRNAKLVEFLSQVDTVQKMIEYVVRSPEDPDDELRALKYPYMASEIICCDIVSITETLSTGADGRIVETLFEFLYQTTPLDPRLAGYFEKILSMLMVRKPQEMTTLMNKHSEKLLAGFVHHTQSFSIAELLKRLLQPYQSDYMDDCMDFPGMSMGMGFPPSNSWYGGGQDDDEVSVGTPTSSQQKTLAWQHETTVIDLLLANLAVKDSEGNAIDSDVHKHSSEVLVDIIHCGTRAQQNDPSSPTSMSSPVSFALLEYLETTEVVEKVIAMAIPSPSDTFCASSMTSSLSVLSALLSRHTNARYSSTDDMPPAVACTVAKLPQICATLRADDHDAGTIRNQRHQEVPRLGLRRLKLVGLVVLLLQSKYHKVDTALVQENAIDICLDLFFKFESVNMLHADVESMVIGILESGSNELLVGLIRNSHLLSRIVEAHERNDVAVAEAKGCSLGYVGHLHRICNMIISLLEDTRGSTAGERDLNEMTHADSILELFEENDAIWKKWEDLSAKVLAPIYERERLPLGGVTISSGNDDPYSVIGFNQSDELLNAQFAEMLGASRFGADPHGFDTDFDIKNDTPMLPEIMNDSSSSEEEDDDILRGAGRDSDEFDFDPRGGSSSFQKHDAGDDDDVAQRWASFESGGSWANFEQVTAAAPAFDASFGSSSSSSMDESEIMTELTETSDSVNSAAELNAEAPVEAKTEEAAETSTSVEITATVEASATTETTVEVEATATTETTVETTTVETTTTETKVEVESTTTTTSESAAQE